MEENITRHIASFNTWINGSKTLTANVLTSLESRGTPCRMVRVKSDSTNTATIHIGSSNLTTSNSALTLEAGDEANILINNTNKIYLITTSASQIVRYAIIE